MSGNSEVGEIAGIFLRRLRDFSRRALLAAMTLSAGACTTGAFTEPPSTTMSEEAVYRSLYPFYAEICAVSQLGKKPGFGADIYSGFGGHAVLYLNGVCRKKDVDYPVLVMCDETGNPSDGVGLSVNAHYQNANWIATEGRGLLLYLNQEGRGIGLANKIRAYELQDEGFDTVEANERLGFKADQRDYGIGVQILKDLGVRSMRLLSNNPRKLVGIEGYGLSVTEWIPLEIPASDSTRRYLKTKKEKMGHKLSSV